MRKPDRKNPAVEPELQQPDAAIKDLEPDVDQAEGVKGGTTAYSGPVTSGWDVKANQKV